MTTKTFSSFPFSQTEEEKKMTDLYKESVQTEKRKTPKEVKIEKEEKEIASISEIISEALLGLPDFEFFMPEEVTTIHHYLLSDMPIRSLFERTEGRAENPFSTRDLRQCWNTIAHKLDSLDSVRNRLVENKNKQEVILNKTKEAQEIIEELKEMDFF